jgi:uncharacterized protein (TIGR03118 family)
MALAPADFGLFSNALLMGNFGDRRINAFDPSTGALLGQLNGVNDQPIVIDGLWGLTLGDGALGADANKLYFTAGIADEAHGLFGSLSTTVPEPGTAALLDICLLPALALVRRRRG